MQVKYRIPIVAITAFGISFLLIFSIAAVIYLGFGQATESTRERWANQSQSLIDSMEQTLIDRLTPVRDQARWVARDVKDVSNLAEYDQYMFGVLAATPQVAGIAIITKSGISRRWHRDERKTYQEDWSQQPWLNDYIEQVSSASGTTWREPIFTDTINASTLLHDVPLFNDNGEFIGIFAQIVPVKEISQFLSKKHADTGITPFVLYRRNLVLVHPLIFDGNFEKPLLTLDELGDLILQRIWTPDDDAAFIKKALNNTQASGVFWGDYYYLFLYRENKIFGPSAWTIGAYLNTNLITDNQTKKMIHALVAGLIILFIAVIAAIILGRKVSNPIKALVRATESVETGKLDQVEPLTGSSIRELDEAGSAFNNMVTGLRERQMIRDTLGRFVPEKVASSLLDGGGSIPVQEIEATILFCDIESFTQLTESLGPVRIVDVLNAYFSNMVEILEKHNGIVTQFQGDAILATFNVPVADQQHAENALKSAMEMLEQVKVQQYNGETLNIRIGINTGSVVAGAIGAKGRLNYTVHGDAVNLAARLEALNKDYQTRLLVSETTANQIKTDFLVELAQVHVRGQNGSIKVFTTQ
ncbi:MAG: adenylate cyclase [Gammaproteobacteria bacterium]|jgi:adenylate cyclase